jgi:hypothetical protein
MSDAEIAAALTAPPPAAPTTPAEAATRLDQAKADPKWTETFLAGHPERVREFHEWHALAAKGESVDRAMAGMYMEGGNTTDHITQMGTAAVFRELGIRDEITRDVLVDKHTVTQAEYNATKVWKEDRMNDKEWVAKLMGGDREAKRKLVLANLILTGHVQQPVA